MGSKGLLSQRECQPHSELYSCKHHSRLLHSASKRDKGSFLCSTLKTALRATLSAESQPCAANIAIFVVIQPEGRMETDADSVDTLIVCNSLHTSTDLKSHHQSPWIPQYQFRLIYLVGVSLNLPWLSQNEPCLRPAAGQVLPKQSNPFILINSCHAPK